MASGQMTIDSSVSVSMPKLSSVITHRVSIVLPLCWGTILFSTGSVLALVDGAFVDSALVDGALAGGVLVGGALDGGVLAESSLIARTAVVDCAIFGFLSSLADNAYRRHRLPSDIPFLASLQDQWPFFSLEGLSNSFHEA